jgi:hypothetical protein
MVFSVGLKELSQEVFVGVLCNCVEILAVK